MRTLAAVAALIAALAIGAAPASADVVRKSNTAPIVIDDKGAAAPVPADPYPSGITFSGVNGTVAGVTVKLNDVSHDFAGDIDLMLVSPTGTGMALMSDAGGSGELAGADITFSDDAETGLPQNGAIATGTYRPSNYGAGGDSYPGSGATVSALPLLGDTFDHHGPNGEWRLYAVDDAINDGGEIAGGWSLTLDIGPGTYTASSMTIADDGSAPSAASVYPSQITVSGVEGVVAEASVQLLGLNHQDPADLDIMLQSPTGAVTTLLSDAGGTTGLASSKVRFDDDAPGQAPENAALAAGSYKPTNHQGADTFPAPAPAQPADGGLAVFDGSDPNGMWKLWVSDDAEGATGGMVGWNLTLTVRSEVRFASAQSSVSEAGPVKKITVSRPEGGGPATVAYRVGTEQSAFDIVPKEGVLSFATSQKTRTIEVPIVDDTGHEPEEVVHGQILAPAGDAVLVEGSQHHHTLTIDDDDPDAVSGDFNGDGRADQAIGIPGEDLGAGKDGAGAVGVMYGSANGLTATGDERFSQDSAGVPDAAGTGDAFGTAVASSDFDGDGFSDLAIGAPGEDIGSAVDAGIVTVLYGSASGLSGAGSTAFHQDTAGLPNAGEAGDRFGAALAAANLGSGSRGDLAIGHPGEGVGAIDGAGAVTALYGGADGLAAGGAQYWHQDSFSLLDAPEADDGFGTALAAGDLGRGGDGDLAIGVPGEAAGAVHVLHGQAAGGLGTTDDQLWSQSTPGVEDTEEAGDEFGSALAVGPVPGSNGNGLAIGVPGEDVGDVADAGGVAVLNGGSLGLTVESDRRVHQNTPDVADVAEAGDRFGSAVALGDFGDVATGVDKITPAGAGPDLAAGVPGEDVGGKADAGAVTVLMYAGDGALLHQDSSGIAEIGEAGDRFGATLAAAPFRGGEDDGLAVGAPGESFGATAGAGALAVLYPAFGGLSADSDQTWHQGAGGLLDSSEAGDGFGGALAP